MKGEAIMITSLHPLGRISLTNRYFTDLVSRAAQSSFGVAGMSPVDTADSLRAMVLNNTDHQGVRVTADETGVTIELHIKVAYGVNIRTSVESIAHHVRSEIERATGLRVAHVNVCVDDVISD